MTAFGNTVAAADVEIGAMLKLMLDNAEICVCHGEPLLASALDTRPWVDVDPSRIPESAVRARDHVGLFLDRQDTTVLPGSRARVRCDSRAAAVYTAELIKGFGAPASAVRIGGTT